MVKDLNQLIERIGGSDKDTASVLAVNASSVSRWRSGRCEIPPYICSYIKLLLEIPKAHLERLTNEGMK